ncbi:hypothetical protein CRM22_000257 [Opisthorchis felineus]|uniref:Uncharacterized protein n=1 Tax=Opisthorchis felineus TaxID=147828 RepID=A0A4S2MG33_OPIFE|nr:hypothetical protein CRM22_000257 [Opisthorchis felineus]TGZ75615.1 hypothetical protein CRM22_000257 [Opisthorchis felineus]
MSSSLQSESTARSDTAIDSYFSCLYTLREKVVALVQHYHTIILQKMDCDVGNLVTCSTEAFQNQLADVFTQLNETELQLNGLEAWAGLPPECFSSIPSNSSGATFDSDQISFEAQTLVELVRRLQVGLRSMVSKNLVTPQTNPTDVAMDESYGQTTSTFVQGQAKQRSATKAQNSRIDPQPTSSAVPSVIGGQVPSQQGYTTISPQVPDTVSYPISEEGSTVAQHGSRLAYQSPTPHFGISASTRSPMTDRRQPEGTEHYSGIPNPNRSAPMAPHSSTTPSPFGQPAVCPYTTGGQSGYSDMISQPHSNRLTGPGYSEPGNNMQSTFRPEYQSR